MTIHDAPDRHKARRTAGASVERCAAPRSATPSSGSTSPSTASWPPTSRRSSSRPGDETAALLNTFAIFAAAFFMRPLGGFFFGPLGDRIGRQRVLALVILLMSRLDARPSVWCRATTPSACWHRCCCCFCVACKAFRPAASTAAAPASWPSTRPTSTAASWSSFLVWSVVVGFLLGSLTVTGLEAVLSGERDGLLRLAHPVPDRRRARRRSVSTSGCGSATPRNSRRCATKGEVAESPLKEAVTTSWRPILQIVGLVVIHNVGFYIVFTFLPSYFTKTLGFTKIDAFVSITVASLVAMMLIPPLGALSDRIGRKPLLIAGADRIRRVRLSAVPAAEHRVAWPRRSPPMRGWRPSSRCSCRASLAAGAELFATRVRSSGYSIGYNVSVAMFGGTAPYVATWLVARTGNELAPALLRDRRGGRHAASPC